MQGLNTNNPDDYRVAFGSLKDGWTYTIERIQGASGYRATVSHPYGDAPSGGVPWPIEDPDLALDLDPARPTYPTIEAAISAAQGYVDKLSELRGYPDPDKMSPRGFRPAIW